MKKQKFAKAVNQERENRRMTQKELGKRVKTSQPNISLIESGKAPLTEASFIGASPNKIETVRVSGDDEVDIFEDTINETKIRYCSTGLIISPANPPEWVKDYVHGVNMQWYGEFKRTRHEQENIESYTQTPFIMDFDFTVGLR